MNRAVDARSVQHSVAETGDTMKTIKAEKILAELNRVRKDMGEDQSDIEWLSIHHAFCFLSYKMSEFQKYLDQEAAKGAFEELEE
jgi:hypothetical protein